MTPSRKTVKSSFFWSVCALALVAVLLSNPAQAQSERGGELLGCVFTYQDIVKLAENLQYINDTSKLIQTFNYNLGPDELKKLACDISARMDSVFLKYEVSVTRYHLIRSVVESKQACNVMNDPSGKSVRWITLPEERQTLIKRVNPVIKNLLSAKESVNIAARHYLGDNSYSVVNGLCKGTMSVLAPKETYNALLFDACTHYKNNRYPNHEVLKDCGCLAASFLDHPYEANNAKQLFPSEKTHPTDLWRFYAATFASGQFPKALSCLKGSEAYLVNRAVNHPVDPNTITYDYMVNGAKRNFRRQRPDCEAMWGQFGRAVDEQPGGVCALANWYTSTYSDSKPYGWDKDVPPNLQSAWSSIEGSCQNKAARPGYMAIDLCSTVTYGSVLPEESIALDVGDGWGRDSDIDHSSWQCEENFATLTPADPKAEPRLTFFRMSYARNYGGSYFDAGCFKDYFEKTFLGG